MTEENDYVEESSFTIGDNIISRIKIPGGWIVTLNNENWLPSKCIFFTPEVTEGPQ